MRPLALLALLFLTQLQDTAPKKKICWESTELYEDSEFKNKTKEDSDQSKEYKEHEKRFTKKVNEEAAEVLAENGFELVECSKHRNKVAGLPAAGEKDQVLHFRVKLSYSSGIFTVTLYAGVEVYDNDNLLCTFKEEKNVGTTRLLTEAGQDKVALRFLGKLMRVMATKINETKK